MGAVLLRTASISKAGNSITVFLIAFLIGIPWVFYHLLSEIFLNGQSIGKRARDLKVIRLDGTQPGLGDYFLRWLLRLIDISLMSGAVAVITILINGRGQRLGDLAAGTTVVRVKASTRLDETIMLPDANYQVVFPQAASLTAEDVTLIRQLFQQGMQRQNYLLLNEVANKVKSLTGIRTDLQDEPFLRTVLRDYAHLLNQV
ncbi:RDD family protein [Hymenobacter sp. HDW8]|uniref:RDD family protein n=1 Tax=Hymenobacter sp. HDW8 TaxID=2714932 RepID=UPI00140C3C94|nr:RDD family protein [Hymenobacter sp. HDW8]QIL75620.1 RDD family protein [Hymenobacter sp. HDW8]